MLTDTAEYQYQLDSQFFAEIDAPEVQKGKVDVTLKVRKTSGIYQLDFQTAIANYNHMSLCMEIQLVDTRSLTDFQSYINFAFLHFWCIYFGKELTIQLILVFCRIS